MSETSDALLRQAFEMKRAHQWQDARPLLMNAVALCREAGERAELARTLMALGQIERDMGELDAALAEYQEAVTLWREDGSRLRLANALRCVGDILQDKGHLESGQFELAEPCYRESLEIYRGNGQTTPLDLANAICGLALLTGATDRAQEAIHLWQEAGRLYASAGVDTGVEEARDQLLKLTAQLPGVASAPSQPGQRHSG